MPVSTCACLMLSLGLALAAPPPGPALLRSFQVGGEGGWDYLNLDPGSGRLYVPRSTRVMVLDLEGKPVGEVPGTPGVHGVALCQELDRGWTSNGQAGTVTEFKLSTLVVVRVIATTGGNPDAILFEPATRRVFTFNGQGRNATVIDAVSARVVATIPLGGKPEFAACDGKGRVYVNDEDNARLLAIDARTLKLEAAWPLQPLERPTGLAMDRERNRLFAVAGNRLAAVLDAGSGRILATLPIGARTDGVAFDPGSGCAYASNGEGSLTVIRPTGPESYTASTVPTQGGARTIVDNPSTGRLYLPTADFLPVAAGAAPGTRPRQVPGSFRILEVGQP